MNKRRRKELNGAVDSLENIQTCSVDEVIEIFQKALDIVENCADEEEESLDNRPESLMYSSLNDDMNDNISDLRDAYDELDILIEECSYMKDFNYELVKQQVNIIINKIVSAINR